jgi:hypothetical protein
MRPDAAFVNCEISREIRAAFLACPWRFDLAPHDI